MASVASASLPVDTSSLAPREPSICIPRVFANITEARVAAIVRNLDLGQLERIDMVQRENDRGEKYQRVFIHFVEWYDTREDGSPNTEAIEVRQRLLKGMEVKVVYDDPWFWKLSASKVARPEDRPKRPQRPRPFLDLAHSAKAPELRKPGNRSQNSRGSQQKGQGRRSRKANQRANTPSNRSVGTPSPQPPRQSTNAPRKQQKRSSPPPPLKLVQVEEGEIKEAIPSPAYNPTSPAFNPTSPHTPPTGM